MALKPVPISDLEADKRRFKIFLGVNILMTVVAIAGLVTEFGLKFSQGRPVWMLALVVGFATQVWLIMGLKRSLKEKGK
jgi:hypothetical protein